MWVATGISGSIFLCWASFPGIAVWFVLLLEGLLFGVPDDVSWLPPLAVGGSIACGKAAALTDAALVGRAPSKKLAVFSFGLVSVPLWLWSLAPGPFLLAYSISSPQRAGQPPPRFFSSFRMPARFLSRLKICCSLTLGMYLEALL